jgi:D-alanyl-D-alanine carboxypeptidase
MRNKFAIQSVGTATMRQVFPRYLRQIFAACLSAAVLSGCGGGADANTPEVGDPPFVLTAPADTVEELKAALMANMSGDSAIAGEALFVRTSKWEWSGAVGNADRKTETMTPFHAFRTGSVTKPFVAAATLRLMEMGSIDIAASIGGYVSDDTKALLTRGGYDVPKITVQQLLGHTSGIYDYGRDTKYLEQAIGNQLYAWTRREQIVFAMENGKPVALPGTAYDYSDTGYIILGEIIERTTGKNIGLSVRELLDYKKLGLVETYWEQLETKPGLAPFAPNSFFGQDLRDADHSFDLYGGGGIISTVRELGVFYRALALGQVFEKSSTLTTLLYVQPVERGKNNIEGNGIIYSTIGSTECIGHGSVWLVSVNYCPAKDVTISWTVNNSGDLEPFSQTLQKLGSILGL